MARRGPPTSTVDSGYSTSAVNAVCGMETSIVRHEDASDIVPLQVIADDDFTSRLIWCVRPYSTHFFLLCITHAWIMRGTGDVLPGFAAPGQRVSMRFD